MGCWAEAVEGSELSGGSFGWVAGSGVGACSCCWVSMCSGDWREEPASIHLHSPVLSSQVVLQVPQRCTPHTCYNQRLLKALEKTSLYMIETLIDMPILSVSGLENEEAVLQMQVSGQDIRVQACRPRGGEAGRGVGGRGAGKFRQQQAHFGG